MHLFSIRSPNKNWYPSTKGPFLSASASSASLSIYCRGTPERLTVYLKSVEMFFCILRSELLSDSANRISTPTLRAPISRNLSSNCAVRYRGHGHCPYCARLFVSISTITILSDAARPERDLSRVSYTLRSSVESRRGWNKYKKATTQVNAIPQRIIRACSLLFWMRWT